MQIFIAEHAGFCEGVSAAYQKAKKHANIYMLGNLVHNAQVVQKLREQGIKVVKSVAEVPDHETILISAHGVPPVVYEEAQAKNLKIIDTTCSWVKRAQKLARELFERGYQVIIVGDKNHPEVVGLVGWSNDKGRVISEARELDLIKLSKKVGVVAQTTQSDQNFNEVVSALQTRVSDLVVHKTICGATQKRQKAAIDLAKKVDLMLVIGDKMSANTKRLTELCSKTGTPTYQIQNKKEGEDIYPRLRGINKIGITAGASTPDWVIKEICDIILS